MKAVIVNDMIGLITSIDKDGDAVAEFGSSYQLQISKQGDVWKVTNGVNGYGNNCRDEFKDATVTPLYESPAPDGWVSVEGLKSAIRDELSEANKILGIADGFTDDDYKYLGVLEAAIERMSTPTPLNNKSNDT